MSTARTADEDADTAALAAALRDAPFVRVVARADGDALAASGILARALRELDVPFQVRTAPDTDAACREESAADAESRDVLLVVGATGGAHALPGDARPASVSAFETARELGVEPDPVLALAGVVAAGGSPGVGESGPVLAAAEERGLVERRPGVAVPTSDLGDGLAHTTFAHVAFSGDPEGARARLAELELPADLDEDARRRVASMLAFAQTTADWSTPRAAESVERALRPYATPDGPFATVGGYGDVLAAVAREQSGLGIALALGRDADELRPAALEAWRTHAAIAHGQLHLATTGRYDGLFVARVEETDPGRLATAARLLRDFRSPEPIALVVGPGGAAVAGDADVEADLGDAVAAAADRVEGVGYGRPQAGEARFDGEVQRFITAFREAIRT
jgi:hypothetical protein